MLHAAQLLAMGKFAEGEVSYLYFDIFRKWL